MVRHAAAQRVVRQSPHGRGATDGTNSAGRHPRALSQLVLGVLWFGPPISRGLLMLFWARPAILEALVVFLVGAGVPRRRPRRDAGRDSGAETATVVVVAATSRGASSTA